MDKLARNRYNVLSLWTTHPYAHLVDFSKTRYPLINEYMPGVYRAKPEYITENSNGKYIGAHKRKGSGYLDEDKDGYVSLEKDGVRLQEIKHPVTNKTWTLEQKIQHWQAVFDHAEKRGIDLFIFNWNVFTHGVTNHHGSKINYNIEQDQTNPETREYMRVAIKEFLLTYPQIDGFGITVGENFDKKATGKDAIETYILEAYGRGVEDAKKSKSWGDRQVDFIFRSHGTEVKNVQDYFIEGKASEGRGFDGGDVYSSVKYAASHVYTTRQSTQWFKRATRGKDNWVGAGFKVWLNIRNDDIFLHRYGGYDFIKDFLGTLPPQTQMAGFYMGSDGYVWGKEFFSTHPNLKEQLEIDKHWYKFKLWGLLSYDRNISIDYWKAKIKEKLGLKSTEDAELLFNTWDLVSEVVPQVNRSAYSVIDAGHAPEACNWYTPTSTGYLTFDKLYFGKPGRGYNRMPYDLSDEGRLKPHSDEKQCQWVRDWYNNRIPGPDTLTPLQVADELDKIANGVLQQYEALKIKYFNSDQQMENPSPELLTLRETLWDIKTMAHLGQFYADKQRSAAWYYVFKKDEELLNSQNHKKAITYYMKAYKHWGQYSKTLSKHYNNRQLLARTNWFDWEKIHKVMGDFIDEEVKTGKVEIP